MSGDLRRAAGQSGRDRGCGRKAVVLAQSHHHWPALELQVSRDDISRPAQWRIRDRRHTVVVHLGGEMHDLTTEMDGHGGSRGGAVPGEVWTIPAERSYVSRAQGTTIHYAVLSFAPTALDQLTGTAWGARAFAGVAGRRDDFLHRAVCALIEATEASDDLARMNAEVLSRAICLHLFRHYAPGVAGLGETERPAGLDPRTARELRDFIHEHLAEPLSLERLAARAELSTHHLLAGFREVFGRTPAQYIIGERLRLAQRLLLRTRKGITTIALECGFSSHSHLTSTFSRQTGMTPREFRRRCR